VLILLQMGLPTSLLLTAILGLCLRTEGLFWPEDANGTQYVERSLRELILNNSNLNEMLDNASKEINGFLFSRNESSAHRTIEIIKEYISDREHFIAQIHVLNTNTDTQILAQSVTLLEISSFLNEKKWKHELNQTKNELSKLEKVLKLYKMLLKLNEMNEEANNLTKQFKMEGKRRYLASAINLTRGLVEDIKSFIQEVADVRNFTVSHNLTRVITNLWIEKLLDTQQWEYLLQNKTDDLLQLERTEIQPVINKYIRPLLFVIIFVVGLAENGVLITIFARYPKIRKYKNMIILNLSIVDSLSLIINLPVFHLYESMSSQTATPAVAQMFMFYRILCFGFSTFSAVALCLQRFSATLKLNFSSAYLLRQSTGRNCIVVISAVWVLSILFAIPHSLYGCIYFKECYNTDVELYSKIANALFTIDLVCLSIIPVIVTTILYWFTVHHLKLRLLRLPAELPERQKAYQRKLLSRSRNIMMLTPIVFAVTSLPYYFYITVDSFLGTDINSFSYTVVKGILYCLIFVNCSFNPAALYFTSGTFRHYVKTHFFWCKRNKDNSKNNQNSACPI